MAQNIKFKVKQFQWFEMQTKVRQIIQQVLGPIQKRIMQNTSVISKVKTNQFTDNKKLQQVVLMIANDPKVFETGVFATVDKKFQQHAKLIIEMQRQIQQENQYIENKFKILDLRMQESAEVLKNVASLKERVTREMELQNDNITSVRTNLQKMISDLNKDIRQTRQYTSQLSQVSKLKDLALQEQIRRIKLNIMTIQDNLTLHRQMHTEKTSQIEDHHRMLEKHSDDIKTLFDNKHLTKKLINSVEDMDNQIKKAMFKIEAISPLITQAQISECLAAILPPKIRKKITIFEHKRYFKLNKEVLEKDFKNVKQKFNGIELVSIIQKKCTKQIVQLKRKKLLQMGIDIDHVTYEQRQKYYSEVSLDDELNMDYEETKVTHKIDQTEIKRIMDQFMEQYMTQFKGKVKIQLDDSKTYLYALEDQIRFEVSKFEKSLDSIKNQCSAHHMQQILELKECNNYSKNIDQKTAALDSKIKETNDLQRLFYNFCSLINHLQIQDQIDKQNISLMGSKQSNAENHSETVQKNSIVALDGNCFSCNGYPATTISAFKMACLAYHPSTIKIDTKQYKREELLQFTTNMLQNIKKTIQNDYTNYNNSSNQQLNEPNQNQSTPPDRSRIIQPKTVPVNTKFKTLEGDQDKRFNNLYISKHIETEQSQGDVRRKTLSNHKFRKTKKTLNTTYSSSYTKHKGSIKKAVNLNEDMMNSSAIFNSLKKQNHSFLN